MKNSININNLSSIEELSDEQTTNIVGGIASTEIRGGNDKPPIAGTGSYPGMGTSQTPDSPRDERPNPIYNSLSL